MSTAMLSPLFMRMSSQCNMDYIVLKVATREQCELLGISYDIACAWYKNFLPRMKKNYPGTMWISDDTVIAYLIPKFHLPPHGSKCQTLFSFNFNRGMGRTHGETVEQEWSSINGAVPSTREMGSGARHAALDDHWGGWNWAKLTGLGTLSAQDCCIF